MLIILSNSPTITRLFNSLNKTNINKKLTSSKTNHKLTNNLMTSSSRILTSRRKKRRRRKITKKKTMMISSHSWTRKQPRTRRKLKKSKLMSSNPVLLKRSSVNIKKPKKKVIRITVYLGQSMIGKTIKNANRLFHQPFLFCNNLNTGNIQSEIFWSTRMTI